MPPESRDEEGEEHYESYVEVLAAARRRGVEVLGRSELCADSIEGLDMQVAGHGTEGTGKPLHSEKRQGLLRYCGYALKPLQNHARGAKEVAFYEALHADPKVCDEASSCVAFLKQLAPCYHGIVAMDLGKNTKVDYLILSNITESTRQPCVMDIKIGLRTYEDSAPEEKKRAEASKFPPQAVIGFRYAGLVLRHKPLPPQHADSDAPPPMAISPAAPIASAATASEPIVLDKAWGRTLSIESAAKGLVHFFHDGHGALRTGPLMELWTQLKDIADWAERQKVASFIGSSLLVVYEPDDGAVVTTTTAVVGDGDGSGVQELQRKVVVKLIDFAHSTVHAQGEGDDNFSTGLRNLYGYVTQLVELSAQLDTSHVSVDHVCEAMFKLPPPMPVASATPAVLLG